MTKHLIPEKIPVKKARANKAVAKGKTPKGTVAKLSIEQSPPKTTRVGTSARRDPPEATVMAREGAVEHGSGTTTSGVSVDATTPATPSRKKERMIGRTLDAMPDRIDIRDWP